MADRACTRTARLCGALSMRSISTMVAFRQGRSMWLGSYMMWIVRRTEDFAYVLLTRQSRQSSWRAATYLSCMYTAEQLDSNMVHCGEIDKIFIC